MIKIGYLKLKDGWNIHKQDFNWPFLQKTCILRRVFPIGPRPELVKVDYILPLQNVLPIGMLHHDFRFFYLLGYILNVLRSKISIDLTLNHMVVVWKISLNVGLEGLCFFFFWTAYNQWNPKRSVWLYDFFINTEGALEIYRDFCSMVYGDLI